MDDPALPLLQRAERYLLTLTEAATRLGITRRSVAGLVQHGKLNKVILKGHVYLTTYEVDLYQLRQQKGKKMIQHQDNLFTGINPHLMSLLQTPGTGATTSTYPSFHNDHITHIKDFLNDYLPPHYIALTEPSLQIQSRESVEESFKKDSQPTPDVAIYQSQARSGQTQAASQAASPTLQLDMQLDEPTSLSSIMIYQAAEHGIHGTPIVRIELLSPANMPGGSYDLVYQQSRTKCLLAGTALVEIDYLHEYPSPIKGMPRYPQEANARPYQITVAHPASRKIDAYLFGINEAIPTVMIPLAEQEFINFNFGEPYAFTWKKSRFWFYVDYSQEPLRIETYSPADQQLIRDHLMDISKKLSADS